MNEQANPRLTAAILSAVDNQLLENEPPETRTTYERLVAEGYSDEEARKLIGAALSAEMYDMLKEQKEYDQERYIETLRKLPEMPWE